MKQKINVGMFGLGTVGSGTMRILRDHAELIRHRVGVPVEVVKIVVRDLTRDRGLSIPQSLLTDDASAVIDDPRIDIAVELIGGYQPALDWILAAIARGKHVVTANKALLAAHGPEIYAAALRAGVEIGFEASVGGGIPVIRTLKDALAADRILSIYGIINGTSNYILTKMTEDGSGFDEALREAQHAGYAEADPTLDIGGIDTAQKLAVLVNLAFGIPVRSNDIFTEGITAISPIDVDFGNALGYKIKLLAIAKLHENKAEARVHPTMIPNEYPISKVGGVYNAIQIVGDACDDIMLYGRGAGSLPTGSAVAGDIIDIARQILREPSRKLPVAPLPGERPVPVLQPIDSITSLYYLRLVAIDQPGVLAQISGVLGRYRISIAQMIQRGRKQGGSVPLVIMTHTAKERDIQKALKEVRALSCITEEPLLIRVEGQEL